MRYITNIHPNPQVLDALKDEASWGIKFSNNTSSSGSRGRGGGGSVSTAKTNRIIFMYYFHSLRQSKPTWHKKLHTFSHGKWRNADLVYKSKRSAFLIYIQCVMAFNYITERRLLVNTNKSTIHSGRIKTQERQNKFSTK